jgi:hypothetical protein
MGKGYLSKMTYSGGLWITGLVLLVAAFSVNLFFVQETPDATLPTSNLKLMPGWTGHVSWIESLVDSTYAQHIFSFLVVLIIGILLQFLTSDRRLIRVRSFFPFFLFCLLASALFPYIHPRSSLVACLFLVWSCFRLFSMTDKKEVNRAVFDASLLLSIASLSMIRLVWLLPFFWLMTGMIQPFTFRNVISSVIGFLCTYWIIGCLSVLFDDYRFLINWITEVINFKWIDVMSFNFIAIVFLGFMAFLMLIAVGSFMKGMHLDKLQTRNLLSGVLVLWLVITVLWLTAGPDHSGYLMILMCPTVLFFAHYFSLTDNFFSRSLFILFVTLATLVFFFF